MLFIGNSLNGSMTVCQFPKFILPYLLNFIIMKKAILLVAVVCTTLITSCSLIKSVTHTASSVDVSTSIVSNNIADLEVGDRVTYKYTPTSNDRKLGVKNCKAAAIASMLQHYKNADIIVSPEFKYDSKLNYVEVTGRPAKYKNFRSAK